MTGCGWTSDKRAVDSAFQEGAACATAAFRPSVPSASEENMHPFLAGGFLLRLDQCAMLVGRICGRAERNFALTASAFLIRNLAWPKIGHCGSDLRVALDMEVGLPAVTAAGCRIGKSRNRATWPPADPFWSVFPVSPINQEGARRREWRPYHACSFSWPQR